MKPKSEPENPVHFTPSEITTRLEKLKRYRHDPVHFEYELIQFAEAWGISVEQCRQLWVNYHTSSTAYRRYGAGFTNIIKSLGILANLSILFGVIGFFLQAETQEKKATIEAWQGINSIPATITANAGRSEAIELLNQGCIEENQPPPLLSQNLWQGWRNLPLLRGFYANCENLKGLNLPRVHLLGVNLAYAQLNSAMFYRADLSEAILKKANLEAANLAETQLQAADLSGAYLQQANLKGANLESANLSGSDLSNADLSFSDLESANLQGTIFKNASLYQANLTHAIYNQQTQPFREIKDFLKANRAYLIANGSDLSKANLSKINLQKASLEGANLEGANLYNSDLTGANLKGANLKRANLRGTNLQGANLGNIDVSGAIYDIHTQIPLKFQAQFKKSAYLINAEADLSQKDLQYADLGGADLKNANLAWANLQRANLRGANLSQTNLENTNLTGAIYDINTQLPKNIEHFSKAYFLDNNKQQLSNTNLQQADLQGISLVNAQLQKSDLTGSNLKNANLKFANLKSANLTDAILTNADIEGADLGAVQGLKPEQVKKAKNWQKAKFSADFSQKL